ncbi:calcium-dependent phosphotriesterase [Astrocystis sublimbata]|nr:calcium-dependent phosphotriesterase [Astrocystis sublimbata]
MAEPKCLSAQLLADGMFFGESPRFHNGRLYMSDMTGHKIYIIDPVSGSKQVLTEVANQPNGLCFNNDGTLIYSSMFDAKLHKYDPAQDSHTLYADMSSFMEGYCGDMAIDRAGRVFLDDTGARVLHGEAPKPGRLLLIDQSGNTTVAAENIIFPNGLFISNDGQTLYNAETFGAGLLKFDLDGDTATLTNRQLCWSPKAASEEMSWASTDSIVGIDGACMDAEGGMWLSMMGLEKYIRLDDAGNITHEVHVDGHATACTLGGEDGKSLFLVTNWVPPGNDLFKAMVGLETKCSVSVVTVEVGKGTARP